MTATSKKKMIILVQAADKAITDSSLKEILRDKQNRLQELSSACYAKNHTLVSDELLALSWEVDTLLYRAIKNVNSC